MRLSLIMSFATDSGGTKAVAVPASRQDLDYNLVSALGTRVMASGAFAGPAGRPVSLVGAMLVGVAEATLF